MANTRKPTARPKPSLADITAKMTPNERVVSLCVAGEFFSEHERLENDLRDAQEAEMNGQTGTRKINDLPLSKEIALKIQALEAVMKKHVYEFTFRQMKQMEWTELLADHPPEDKTVERINIKTLAPVAVQRCCVQPAGFDDPDTFTAFWNGLTSGQQGTLFGAAWDVNEGGVSVPFSVNASVTLSTSKETSTTAPR